MSKIIDLVPYLKTINFETKSSMAVDGEVVDISKAKQTLLFHERRQVKRTLLSELVSSMVVVPEKGLLKVSLHDISEEGVAFDLDIEQGQFKIGEEISLRVYLNQKTYFPIQVVIKHVTTNNEEGLVRHGAEYLKNQDNHVALQHFVKFVESASQEIKNDSGDLMVTRTS